ncbi:heme-binding domain-containing protein [uncultured Polaribacter sp.]|uniref:heme-binding domain-containing protein n=1 Tax=uncultured Polaribacter sp. TaxID=174711 RepID=UPI0026354956|nr:heme-binding domain-containing protein [uncultured Polaribacter sp.]
MKINKKTVLKILVALLVIIQFFGIDKTTTPVNESKDFVSVTNPPVKVATIIKTSCYDCHSNQTNYPWYTNIAPVSWWIGHHIEEGREHLDFSNWGDYSKKKADHKLEEFYEEVEEGEMPLTSYTSLHGEAKLSEEDKALLIAWVKTLRQ